MLADDFAKKIVPELMKKLGEQNPLAVPRPKKVVLNMGVAAFRDDEKAVKEAKEELAKISGQWPEERRARKAVSGFHLRRHELVALRVTLRRRRMYDFLERLFNLVIPQLRDFHGLPLQSFDKYGNYTLGLSEQVVFPEISPDEVHRIKGLEITIVTTAGSRERGRALLEALGAVFEKEENGK